MGIFSRISAWWRKAVEEAEKQKEIDDIINNAVQTIRRENEERPTSEWWPEWKSALKRFHGGSVSEEEEEAYREYFDGDGECLYNLKMYMARVKDGPVCIHAMQDDHYRPRYETLSDTGAMLTGESISPTDRLLALSMQELRGLAKAIGVPNAKSKNVLAANISVAGDDAILAAWPSTGIDIANLFYADADMVREAISN